MTDILTVTLNPALDIATSANRVTAGPKLRCDPPAFDPGGGGINVSRSIQILGGQSRAFVALAGPTGQRVQALLASEGIETLPFEAPGETRESLAVTDKATGQQYRFVLPGPEWTETGPLIAALGQAVNAETLIVVSGSNPPGIPQSFITQLNNQVSAHRTRLLADTSGPALHHLAQASGAPLYALRMDQAEAEALAGSALPSARSSADFGAELVGKGVAKIVAMARGAEGSVMTTAQHKVLVSPPKVPVRSKIGAGDSFVGAFSMGLAQGDTPTEALHKGVAAAAAAVMSDATGLCRRADFESILPQCILTQLG